MSHQPAHLLSKDDRLKKWTSGRPFSSTRRPAYPEPGPLLYIGLGFFQQDGFLVQQLFMRDYIEERASLPFSGIFWIPSVPGHLQWKVLRHSPSRNPVYPFQDGVENKECPFRPALEERSGRELMKTAGWSPRSLLGMER
jgi:hypothetical protein